MGHPKVVLIGGAPMIGKTTVACRVASRLGRGCLCTDDLGEAARAVTTAKSHPPLHPMAGLDYREYYTSSTPNALIDDADRAHEALWPAVKAVVECHATWSTPAVIEGWAIRPPFVAQLESADVAAAWLTADSPTLEARIRDSGFHHGSSDEEKMIRNFLARSDWYNSMIEETAGRLGFPVVKLESGTSTSEAAEACIRELVGG